MEKDTSSEAIELLEEAIFKFPHLIKQMGNQSLVVLADEYLPYSTGIEVECNNLPEFNVKDFESIPDIMDVNCDEQEKRFRIPPGVTGLICLWNICDKLLDNCSLNMGSGIHYHIDMSDCYDLMNDVFMNNNNVFVIEELKKWGTAKELSYAYCSRSRAWVRYADEHKTLEIRIGEMTFDYNIIVGRIIHCNDIVRELKSRVDNGAKYLLEQARQLSISLKEEEKPVEEVNVDEIIRKRIVRYAGKRKNIS